MSHQKLVAVVAQALDLTLFTKTEGLALEYADAMTTSDVSDDLFARINAAFGPDEIVELTETIAWENASARFNRALRVPSQGLWNLQPNER